MSRVIKYQEQYLNLDRVKIRTPVLSEFGDVIWEREPDPRAPEGSPQQAGKHKLKVADTYEILREIVRTLSRVATIHKSDDPQRSAGLYNQIETAEEGKGSGKATGDITLGNKTYEWLHTLLSRQLPLVKEAKDRGDQPVTFAFYLWQSSAAYIQNQLRDQSDTARKDDKGWGGEED